MELSDVKFSSQQNYLNFPVLNYSQRTKTLNRSSSSSFLERNYTKYNQEYQNKRSHRGYILSQDNLNALLCKLKNYYNEVLCMTTKKQKNLNILRDSSSYLNFQHSQLLEFQDIDLPDEKISVKNFNELKVSKEQIENSVRTLLKEKGELDYKYKNELEYSKTIEYMYEKEKMTLEKIHEVTKQTEEKIATIQKYQKSLDDNINERKKKKQNFLDLLTKLKNDINIIKKVSKNQAQKNTNLDSSIIQKEADNEELKEKIKMNQERQYSDIRQYKENVKHQINITNEKMKAKIEKEKMYIKTILCLELIQKYFINKEEFSITDLNESKEYKDFLCERLTLYDDNNNIIFNSDFNSQNINGHHHHFGKTKSNFSKTAISFGPGKTNKTTGTFKHTRLTLSELKSKFDNLNLTKEMIYEYHSKITNRINFYRNTLKNYNNKQIFFENKKDKFSQKVKEILNKDYKNFEDLINNNSRFDDFISKNRSLIQKAKEKRELIKNNKVINVYTAEELKENEDNELITHTPLETMAIDLYKNCHSLIRENKNFFENIARQCEYYIDNHSAGKTREEISRLNEQIASYLNDINSYSIPQFEAYIKTLYSFIKDNNKSYKTEQSANLLKFFYIDDAYSIPNKQFIKHFLKKNIQIESEVLYHLSNQKRAIDLLDQTLVLMYSKVKDLQSNRAQSSDKKNQESTVSIDNTSNTNNNAYNNNVNLFGYSKLLNLSGKNESMKTIRTKNGDEDDSLSEAETTQHEIKVVKKRNNSLDDKIIKKLYEPHLAKTFYIRRLNGNMKYIKGMTNSSSKTNFALCKKRGEVDEMSRRLIIYNNPKININEISNQTYNSVLSYIFHKQNQSKTKRQTSKSFYDNRHSAK